MAANCASVGAKCEDAEMCFAKERHGCEVSRALHVDVIVGAKL